MFGGTEFRFCLLFEISDNTDMTESELCPPDPRIKYLIKKSKVLLLYLKKHATDVRIKYLIKKNPKI